MTENPIEETGEPQSLVVLQADVGVFILDAVPEPQSEVLLTVGDLVNGHAGWQGEEGERRAVRIGWQRIRRERQGSRV